MNYINNKFNELTPIFLISLLILYLNNTVKPPVVATPSWSNPPCTGNPSTQILDFWLCKSNSATSNPKFAQLLLDLYGGRRKLGLLGVLIGLAWSVLVHFFGLVLVMRPVHPPPVRAKPPVRATLIAEFLGLLEQGV